MTPLPSFFVIGAPKAGTTSLRHYLAAHPQVQLTSEPDPHVFAGEGWRSRLGWYQELFTGTEPIRGESSPGYACAPVDAGIPARIAEVVPDARFLYLVRDPVERTIAHYEQAVHSGRETRPAEAAIDPADPGCRFLACSRYAVQLENYRRHFPAGNILVLDQDQLRADRRRLLGQVFRFIGADPGFWSPALEVDHNVRGADNVRLPRWAYRLRRSGAARRVRGSLPAPLRRRLGSAARRGLGSQLQTELGGELRTRLEQQLRPEAERLRELTGSPFPGWSV